MILSSDSTFHVVHPREVTQFFERIGLHDEFHGGSIQCNYCEDTITPANFKAATRQRGKLLFTCDKAGCYERFLAGATESSE